MFLNNVYNRSFLWMNRGARKENKKPSDGLLNFGASRRVRAAIPDMTSGSSYEMSEDGRLTSIKRKRVRVDSLHLELHGNFCEETMHPRIAFFKAMAQRS